MHTLVKASTRTWDIADALSDTLSLCDIPYFRFQPVLSEKTSMDGSSPAKLVLLQELGRSYVAEKGYGGSDIRALAELLKPDFPPECE